MATKGWFPCCGNCVVRSDNFDRADGDSMGDDWTEHAGDCDIASNAASLVSNDTVVIHDVYSIVPDTDGQIIKGDVYGNEAGVQGRIMGGAVIDQATDRWWYAQIEFGATDSTLKLFLYEEGTGHTQHGETITVSGVGTGSTVELWLCLVPEPSPSANGHVTATVKSGSNVWATRSDALPLPTHSKAGFGCGTAPVSAGNLTVDNWEGRRSSEDTTVAGCPDCPEPDCAANCEPDTVPSFLSVEISGCDTTPACCEDLEGTYILSFVPPGTAFNSCGCGPSPSGCFWESAVFDSPCNQSTNQGCVAVDVYYDGTDTTLSVNMILSTTAPDPPGDNNHIRLDKTISGTVDCSAWNEEQVDSVAQKCDDDITCDSSNIVVKITSL